MRPVFISYKQDPWQSEVFQLADELRLRGIRVFLDAIERAQFTGRGIADFLRQVVETETDAFLVYLAAHITESQYVWDLEVPAALGRRDRDADYLLLPFFRDRRPTEVRDSMPPHGSRLAALGGIVAVPSEGASQLAMAEFMEAKWREAALRLLDALVHRWVAVLGKQGRPLRIDIYTRVEGPGDADLNLDWRSQFPGGGPPSKESWHRIQMALKDLLTVVPRLGPRSIRVSGNAHLSAALLLGYTLPQPMGFQFEVDQYGSWWSSVGSSAASGLEIVSEQLDPSRRDILLVVAISRPEVIPNSMDYLTRTGIVPGGRIVAQPRVGPGPNALVGADEARDATREIVGALTQARAQWGTGVIHMFLAAPLAFAALLGHQLNACAPIRVYEHDKVTGEYAPGPLLT